MATILFLVFLVSTPFHIISAFPGPYEGTKSEIIEIVGLAESTCHADTDCSHGLCDKRTKTCTCDIGWTGITCNELIPYKNIGEGPQTKEVLVKEKEKVTSYLVGALNIAENPQKHTNRRPIDLRAGIRFKSTPKIEVKLVKDELKKSNTLGDVAAATNTKPESMFTEYEANPIETEENDACSNRYKYKAIEIRSCSTGLECEYGRCSSKFYGSYVAFECTCDKGARGLLCEQKCCLDCGSNGQCDFYPDGTPFCFCRRGYYGTRCEFTFTKMLQTDRVPLLADSSNLQQQL